MKRNSGYTIVELAMTFCLLLLLGTFGFMFVCLMKIMYNFAFGN